MAALSRIVSHTLGSHWWSPAQLTQHWPPIGWGGQANDPRYEWRRHNGNVASHSPTLDCQSHSMGRYTDIQIYRYTTLEAAWLWCLARPACSTTTTSPRWRTASLQRWLAVTSPHQSTTAFYCHPPQHFTYEKDPNNSKNFKTSFICSKHKRVVVDNPYVYISMKYRV